MSRKWGLFVQKVGAICPGLFVRGAKCRGCNSRNVAYLINCKLCGFQYVGSTITKFRLRFNNHKSRIRAHCRMSAVDKESDDLVYMHFYSHGHHGLSDVSIQLIGKVTDKDDLLAKEDT